MLAFFLLYSCSSIEPTGKDACSLCDRYISTIETLLNSNKTLDFIAGELSGLCTRLDPPYNTFCKQFTSIQLAQILELLKDKLEKTEICQKLGFPQNTPNADYCDTCHNIIKTIEGWLLNPDIQKMITTVLLPLCRAMAVPYAGMCEITITTYLPNLLETLEKQLDNLDVCRLTLICPLFSSNQIDAPKGTNSDPCTTCRNLVSTQERMLESPDNQEFVVSLVILWACNEDLQCMRFASTFVPDFMNAMSSRMKKSPICKDWGLCNNIENKDCSQCASLILKIESYMTQGLSQEAIAKLLREFCSRLPKETSDFYKLQIDTTLPDIMRLIEEGTEAESICKRFGLCSQLF